LEKIGYKNAVGEPGKYLLANKKSYFDELLNEFSSEKDSFLLEHEMRFSYESYHSIQLVFHSPFLVSFAEKTYGYTGGAHGNYGTSYTSFDLKNNRQLGLKQIFHPAALSKLNRLLEKYYRRINGFSDTEPLDEDGGLFEKSIQPNDNFFVTETGITFNYVPYEIASYSMGEISIFIPFEELKNDLLPGFSLLLRNQ
jgi:hypothetical protein